MLRVRAVLLCAWPGSGFCSAVPLVKGIAPAFGAVRVLGQFSAQHHSKSRLPSTASGTACRWAHMSLVNCCCVQLTLQGLRQASMACSLLVLRQWPMALQAGA